MQRTRVLSASSPAEISVNQDSALGLPPCPWNEGSSRPLSIISEAQTVHTVHIVKALPNPHALAGRRKPLNWTPHKWFLLTANTLLLLYSLFLIVVSLVTYLGLWKFAAVTMITEMVTLNILFSAGLSCLITSIIGYIGIMLNNRAILTIYNLLLWPCFVNIAAIGYFAYRGILPSTPSVLYQRHSRAWHHFMSPRDRLVIQSYLHCCGYREFVDLPERSGQCFPRTIMPSCRHKLYDLTVSTMQVVYIGAFSIIPAHIFVIAMALLCSRHVDRRFGKGLPPKIYRVENVGLVTPPSESNDSSDNSAWWW
ncbi:tetraspanin Tsp2 [Endogone sp. FLAS-F59071]|nr:tetraspanin Tsp2 [Endogone sp. FLAS-F59071]|eukprot:RUS14954.1 tetraspanin Tsp2 [Endogone sp. FLAS-F59071]